MRFLRSATLIVVAAFLALTCATIVGTTQETVKSPGRPKGTGEVPENPPETCRVTRPAAHPFVPPAPYRTEPPGPEVFWFGTEKLWSMLPVDGTWRGLRPYSPTTLGFRQKIFWWRKGYDKHADPSPELTVKGKRLDGPAPSFFIPRATNGEHGDWGQFMLVGADIPTRGCWEITGRFKGDELTFVVWVAP